MFLRAAVPFAADAGSNDGAAGLDDALPEMECPMIVYGDLARRERADAVAASVADMLRAADRATEGIDRHAALAGAFIRAGELVQGHADADFQRRGFDGRSIMADRGAELLAAMAAAVDRSWRNGFAGSFDLLSLLRRVDSLGSARWISTRTGEGYAHYALYPESYLEAARRAGLGPRTCVIGIRSIGTGLAALVAVALGARPAASVRPVGHPFEREIRAALEIVDVDPADPASRFAVVDEGPGLSGSSFAGVAKWLCSHGAEPRRIHFFPSHDGEPGHAASAETREIWRRCPRHPARTDEVLLGPRGLPAWLGRRIGPLEDFPVAAPVPCDPRFERRKFLARGQGGPWVVRFAGLGPTGARKQGDARALARAGFTPGTRPLRYGFLIQKHVEGQVPAVDGLSASGASRRPFLQELAAYLAFRATRLGPPCGGASLETLRAMAVENAREALGAAGGRKMERQLRHLASLEETVRRVRTDNRLHPWEWIVADGRFVKLDAVDHCEAHDLVGCQDIAWDVAGAIAEYGLDGDEAAALRRRVEAGGAKLDPALVAGLLPCYLAFQLGLWTTASGHGAGAQAERYLGALHTRLYRRS